MIVFFFAGWPVPKVAVIAGALLLLTRRVKPERVYREIDWSLLVMFIGLFIVIAGIEKTPLAGDLFAAAGRFHLERIAPMSVFAALLSNLVSNVPAVLVFKTFVPHLADPARAWLTLAMSSTLAGNLTLLGSVANLIVVQRARRRGGNHLPRIRARRRAAHHPDAGRGCLDVKLAACPHSLRVPESGSCAPESRNRMAAWPATTARTCAAICPSPRRSPAMP